MASSQLDKAYIDFMAKLSEDEKRALRRASQASGKSVDAILFTDLTEKLPDRLYFSESREANPADIAAAKIDGTCPECGKPGAFGDADGYCLRCGWGY